MIRASWVARIRSRAGFRCEYCRLPEAAVLIPFEIEHIVPRQHGGRDLLGNLALSCLHCNRHKGRISQDSMANRSVNRFASSTPGITIGRIISGSIRNGSGVEHPLAE